MELPRRTRGDELLGPGELLGLRYFAHAGFFAAVAAYFRWMRRMGLPEPA